jgi:hypothetical protein
MLMGLGMHPTLKPKNIPIWDHDEMEYYDTYNRLFNLQQHGWVNIQSLQINLPYHSEEEMVKMYNRIRVILPYLIAVTASSPVVEGKLTGIADNRLVYYRENQRAIPEICNNIIPEPIESMGDYCQQQQIVFDKLMERKANCLCEEWLNSSGVIVRFSRKCLEIKALDAQECIRSDMAVCAFVQALMRDDEIYDDMEQDILLDLTEQAIVGGTRWLQDGLYFLYATAIENATPEESEYLPIIQERIFGGSLAEQIQDEYYERKAGIWYDMMHCLQTNQPYP